MPAEPTVRLTVAQAMVRFLAAQYTERDGVEQRLFAGCFGIFGHGNVAGFGQALLQSELDDPDLLTYVLGRNEQAMVHSATAYAKMTDRLQTWVVTSSIGPGATNMVTGAALATINRLPVLLLPGDTFADRSASPLLQELELPQSGDVTVNDCFRPVSKYFDRIWRPEQMPAAMLSAMRVLTDPAESGAVTVCIPQDVQVQAYDWPSSLFAKRVWHVARPVPEPSVMERAVEVIRGARRPMVVAGGGVVYSQATEALAQLCETTGIPVGQTQAGKGTLVHDHPQCLGAVGSTGTTAANAIAREADVVVGIGTRWSDFTTASRTAFQADGVRFVNVNVAMLDATKHAGLSVVADAREAITALTAGLRDFHVSDEYAGEVARLKDEWEQTVDAAYHPRSSKTGLLTQAEVIGRVNELSEPRDVVVCAAGSMPGDLHKLWRTRDPKGYHVEYGYSCMGYEIAGGMGAKLACPDRDVFVMVGDGSYLMMPSELVTAVQERVKVIVVLVQNHGFASIGALSEQLGSQRFGTRYRFRSEGSRRLDGDLLPVDLAVNAESLGVDVIRAGNTDDLTVALKTAKAATRSTLIHVETDPFAGSPDSQSWWDVPVSEVSDLESTQSARKAYEQHKAEQRAYVRPATPNDPSAPTQEEDS
jgi:3D-(3,5/4)-trihydroxycyclohexane-1,2-dione acylhydrolase (decyclizing)